MFKPGMCEHLLCARNVYWTQSKTPGDAGVEGARACSLSAGRQAVEQESSHTRVLPFMNREAQAQGVSNFPAVMQLSKWRA